MKKIIIACMLLIPSFASAWSSGFDVMVKELKQAIPEKYTENAIVNDNGRYIIWSYACVDKEFVSNMRKKYEDLKESKHIKSLGVNSIVCQDWIKSKRIF